MAMALAECRECGREVSTEAQSCPQCGVPSPTRGAERATPPVSPTPVSQGERTWQVVVARPSAEGREFLRPLLQASYPSATEAQLNHLLERDQIVVRVGLSRDEANALMQQLDGAGLLPRKVALGSPTTQASLVAEPWTPPQYRRMLACFWPAKSPMSFDLNPDGWIWEILWAY
jgi:hypothetical protein